MTFTEIRYFVDVADCMSFTKAAERNFVAQQVISKQIKKLEDELGYQLFDRSGRQLELSEAGAVLYPFWKETLQKQINILQETASIVNGKKRTVHVGCISISPVYDILSEAIAESANMGCNKHYQVDSASYIELIKQLIEGKLDCIVTLSDETSVLQEGFAKEELDNWKPELIISANHPLYKENLNYSELQNTTIYMLSTKFAFNAEKNVFKCCKYYGFIPKKVRYFDDVASLEMALYAGQGATFIYPQFFRNPHGILKNRPIDECVADCNRLTLVYNQSKYEELKPFIEALKRHTHLVVKA